MIKVKEQFHLREEAQLAGVAAFLLRQIQLPSLIALEGPLGAGKTTLVKYILRELGCSETAQSPTFGKLHEYPTGEINIYHLDCYRSSLSLEEWAEISSDSKALVLIEWFSESPDYQQLRPFIAGEITFQVLDNSERLLSWQMVK